MEEEFAHAERQELDARHPMEWAAIIEIRFQDVSVIAIGKNLEPLYDALARLSVERIKMRPDNYGLNAKDGVITEIEIKNPKGKSDTAI